MTDPLPPPPDPDTPHPAAVSTVLPMETPDEHRRRRWRYRRLLAGRPTGPALAIRVAGTGAAADSTIASLQRNHPRVMLLAVQRDGRSHFPPPPDLRLRPGDMIAAAGGDHDLGPLEAACAAPVACPP